MVFKKENGRGDLAGTESLRQKLNRILADKKNNPDGFAVKAAGEGTRVASDEGHSF